MPCEASAKQGLVSMHYVYLIESIGWPGKKYVGYTGNLRHRIAYHNFGQNLSTAPYKPWRLRGYLAFDSKSKALAFERYMKSGSGHAFANKRLW
jgi:predicted GIY-YIG superfamily endonuclease